MKKSKQSSPPDNLLDSRFKFVKTAYFGTIVKSTNDHIADTEEFEECLYVDWEGK